MGALGQLYLWISQGMDHWRLCNGENHGSICLAAEMIRCATFGTTYGSDWPASAGAMPMNSPNTIRSAKLLNENIGQRLWALNASGSPSNNCLQSKRSVTAFRQMQLRPEKPPAWFLLSSSSLRRFTRTAPS